MARKPEQSRSPGRRPLGPREASAMQIFWRRPGQFLTVRQVSEALDAGLAYTTVMTLLTRLHRKGFLERQLDGRAWTYRPLTSQSQYAASAMTAALHDSDDHAQALFHFVERLTPEEQEQLRRKLGDDGR